MNGDEKRKFVYEFKKIKDELCEMVIKITNGRINSFRLRSQPKLIEHIDDIIQDAVINVFRYINRFDEERGTSAFAYVTQLISNAIMLDLKKIEEHLTEAVRLSASCGLSREELGEMLELLWEG